MLLMITNRCQMNCQHCMQCSIPGGASMSMDILDGALRFAEFLDPTRSIPLVVSGGEPTLHTRFSDFCERIAGFGFRFSVCSNGMWLLEEGEAARVLAISDIPEFVGMQVYTNPRYYPRFSDVKEAYVRNRERWGLAEKRIVLDETPIRAMNDLGRARHSHQAMEDVMSHPYHQPCLVAHLTARQVDTAQTFAVMMANQGHFCTPLVDIDGRVHMSESWTCPSVGHVLGVEGFGAIWKRMHDTNPCCQCVLGRKFLNEDTPKMRMVRAVLGISERSPNLAVDGD